MTPRLLALGDAALTLELGDGIDAATSARVMAARAALVAARCAGIGDIVPTYRSLTVHFDPLHTDRDALAARLLAAADAPQNSALAGRHHEIPVHFGGADGPDLDFVAAATGRDAEEIVATLCASNCAST